MTEMFGEAWPPMSVPDLAPDDDDEPVSSKQGNAAFAEDEQMALAGLALQLDLNVRIS